MPQANGTICLWHRGSAQPRTEWSQVGSFKSPVLPSHQTMLRLSVPQCDGRWCKTLEEINRFQRPRLIKFNRMNSLMKPLQSWPLSCHCLPIFPVLRDPMFSFLPWTTWMTGWLSGKTPRAITPNIDKLAKSGVNFTMPTPRGLLCSSQQPFSRPVCLNRRLLSKCQLLCGSSWDRIPTNQFCQSGIFHFRGR